MQTNQTQRLPSKFQEACLEEAIADISAKGFNFIKFELEATLHRGRTRNESAGQCTKCDGTGSAVEGEKVIKCTFCTYGSLDVPKSYDFSSDSVCKSFILNSLPNESKKDIVFSKFYNDGSVDSEYTVTVPIRNVRTIIHIINAFIEIARLNGRGIDTAGAGMHIALLNDPKGNYARGNDLNYLHSLKTQNMQLAMSKLMPALYFLGSADHRSRSTHYREPFMSNTKYSAINTASHVLEYRVFETCYRNPYRVYEFVEVIANTLKFYDDVQQLPSDILESKVFFKKPAGSLVRRFYDSPTTLDSLMRTLPYLKPKSRTIEAVKRSRGFKLDARQLGINQKIQTAKVIAEWPEYIERLGMMRRTGADVSSFPQTIKQYLKKKNISSADTEGITL